MLCLLFFSNELITYLSLISSTLRNYNIRIHKNSEKVCEMRSFSCNISRREIGQAVMSSVYMFRRWDFPCPLNYHGQSRHAFSVVYMSRHGFPLGTLNSNWHSSLCELTLLSRDLHVFILVNGR